MIYFEPYEIERILTEVINRFLLPKFRELGMPATGEWEQNLEVEARGNSGVIRGRNYTEQLAKGRAPGRKPPIAPLQKWVQAKFGISGDEARSAAFAVANKIAKEGTSWYPSGSDLLEVLESPMVIEFLHDEMRGILQVRLTENLIRNAQEALL